jgi:2,3-dihydroxybenzoate decarboxylase
MIRKIAVEEYVLSPGLIEYWLPGVATLDRTAADILFRRLTDLGESRLEAMARGGIERAVLSIAGPGVAAEPVIGTAARRAREANDFLAREIAKRPQSYLGFAHLPLQDPADAAAELERCVRELGFCGALIHGHSQDHSNGRYLDDPMFEPLWERVGALDAPLYLQRTEQAVASPVLEGYPELYGWESAFETGSRILRLVFGGVFDRHPKARVIVGRLGEALPYQLSALDAQARRASARLERLPSDCFRENIFVTTAGLEAAAPLYCAISTLGATQVMFATGYPFRASEPAAQFLDRVRLDENLRADIAFRNAERLLGL